ncbi:hypothetical protein JMJ58_19475 [Haloterrigena salifodinae]|uniref:Uncharacterized protein n=1 Tax=Haloterrigena salifodinae TaxID=2675099 RepID=A0A8T8E0F0_9EURY|nr:hypothetical protein [Haloterrigena salifodinae]QRV15062.1 hypothetical protein JMJ58_19475 [Haloterrigena salifodinae]
MLEVLSAVGTLLILFFSGLTFWHQFLRTPRSDVGISATGRSEPYSTNAGKITFTPSAIQIFNEGDMEALVANADVSVELIDADSGEVIDIPSDSSVGIKIKESKIGKSGRLPVGINDRVSASMTISGVSNLPREFYISIFYELEIRDNIREYELSETSEFKFVNERVDR